MKIYYNNDGWVCHRVPYNFSDEVGFIEVSEEENEKTLSTRRNFAWKVVDGELVNVRIANNTDEENLEKLRDMREWECFPIINRGVLWYNLLTTEQQQQLNTWYQAWLNVPQVYLETKPTDIETIIPIKPSWLK